MADWAFILKDADGMSEPQAHRVRNFLKRLGRNHGLSVAFAPVPPEQRPASSPTIRPSKRRTRQTAQDCQQPQMEPVTRE
jgi:hypothetical protein